MGLRLCLGLVLLIALAAPGTAQAQAPLRSTMSPADGAALRFGAPLPLVVRTDLPPDQVRLRLSGATRTDADGRLTGDGLWLDVAPTRTGARGVLAWTPSPGSILHRRPGRYAWQVLVTTPEGVRAGPVGHFELILPRAATRPERLHPRYGRRGTASLAVSSAGLPPSVDRARFGLLAAEAAKRWGMTAGRSTSARAGEVDGRDVVGFSDRVGPEALGIQVDVVERRYRRAASCAATDCATALEPAGTRVVERDILLRSQIAWHAEEAPPPLDRVDLETALLHELGHLAGNKGHVGRCENSPLLESLAPGEWWRGGRNRWIHCPAGVARAARAGAGPRRGFERRVVVRRRIL